MERVYQPAGFCPRCGYALDPGRCPECGSVVTAKDMRPRQARMSKRARRLLFTAGLAFALFVAVGVGFELESWVAACGSCGALCDVRELRLFGVGGQYSRRVHEGPLSQFLQRRAGAACAHHWAYAVGGGGGLLGRYCGQGRGRPIWSIVARLEGCSSVASMLNDLDAADSEFAARLRELIGRTDYDDQEFYFELLDECDKRSTTALPDGEPGRRY